MFGISIFEFIIILIIIILIFRPTDIPILIKDLYKMFLKLKNFFIKAKQELKSFNNSLGIDDIEKNLKEQGDEIATIIDIYGKEHQVKNLSEIRKDLSKEEINKEIFKSNSSNIEKT